MGANKPRKLEALTHQNIKKFKSDFSHYHHETNGQATLMGHISDEIVAVIDSLLGAREEYRQLLCHDTDLMYVTEAERLRRPWLERSAPQDWGKILEALLVLKPPSGAYQTQTYENLLARAETTFLNFAYDHQLTGEDKYIERLLESDKVCEVSQYTPEQIKAYFHLLIVGSKVPGSSYKGFNVNPKSRDPQDASRVEVMKEKAMLSIREFRKTRHFVDWVINYASRMREALSAVETFQGRSATVNHRGGSSNRGRGAPGGEYSDGRSAGYTSTEVPEDSILVLQQGAAKGFPEGPCKGCGAPHQHRTTERAAVPHSQCPLRSHPDWNSANTQFNESAAGLRMVQQSIPFVTKKGIAQPGSQMNRLSAAYRAMLDTDGMPMKLDPPVQYAWQQKADVHQPGETYVKRARQDGRPKSHPGAPQGCPRNAAGRPSHYMPVHACCTVCTTPAHAKTCTTTCNSCDETRDIEHINALTSTSLSDNDTSLAMLYAVNPQAELGAEDTGDEGADGVLGDATMPRRAIIKSSPVRIFLDSGCLAGNYIREDIAHMLAKGHPNFFTPVITNVCGAFGE